ncbi:hypothetical protein OIV83_004146 [Microbotryomycetes sp. JL201]|nr:hypothetical protein OIV83_004146 [Microbotryomycetes sp. JL201]
MSDASGGQPPVQAGMSQSNGVQPPPGLGATTLASDASMLPPLPGAPAAPATATQTPLAPNVGTDAAAPAPSAPAAQATPTGAVPGPSFGPVTKIWQKQSFGTDPAKDLYYVSHASDPTTPIFVSAPLLDPEPTSVTSDASAKVLALVSMHMPSSKRVNRSHAQLEQLCPDMLHEFLQQYPPPVNSNGPYLIGEPFPGRSNEGRPKRASTKNYAEAGQFDDEQDDGDSQGGRGASQYKDDAGDFNDDDEEDEEESGSDFDDGSDGGSRKKKFGKRKSPKKLRSFAQRIAHKKNYGDYDGSGGVYYDDELAEVLSVPDSQASRRSSRARRRINYEEEFGGGGMASDTGSYATSDVYSAGGTRQAKMQRPTRLEEIFPDDLDDIEPDAELGWAAQFQHRRYCARCEQPPVPEALQKHKARRSKKGGRGNKKKPKSVEAEFEEDSDQEIERISKLGAWMKCNVCIEAYHFQCMPGALRKEFTDVLKDEHEAAWLAENPPPPPPVYDPSEYVLDEETGEMVPPLPPPHIPPPRPEKPELDMRMTFVIPKCWSCKKVGGRRCFVCGQSGRKVEGEPLDVPAQDRPAEHAADKPDAAGTILHADSPLPPLPTESVPAAAPSEPAATVQPSATVPEVTADAAAASAPASVPAQPDTASVAPAPSRSADVEMTPATSGNPAPAAVLTTSASNRAEDSFPQSGATTAATATPAPMAEDAEGEDEEEILDSVPPSLMFRCSKCHRASHYSCLAPTKDEPEFFEDTALAYFRDGLCHDCYRWNVVLDVILAWAEDDSLPELPKDEIDEDDVVDEIPVTRRKDPETGKIYEIPNVKDVGARAKYLVKWQHLSYRQLSWVPHAYLAAVYPAKLGNFLARGSQVVFDAPPAGDEPEEADNDKTELIGQIPLPDPNAEERIPKGWITPDRILNVWYQSKKVGETAVVEHRHYRGLPEDPAEAVKLIKDAYIKWGDLPYSNASRETPPDEDDETYPAFFKAYKDFLRANSPAMRVPLHIRQPRGFNELKSQPEYVKGGELMPFQLEGVNFLYFKWSQRQGCILADEMGLGKTVQIITFLSVLYHEHRARPFLVTVPNSTIGNWVREFERWAPDMRVVPYSGDIESRRIIEDYELYDLSGNLKTDVVLATYESLEKNIETFRGVSRWDALVVDEGQRLKSGTQGLLFNALQSLNIGHHVLLSGTPLNNNIIELFNLLSFIDPGKWNNLEELTERYAELNPELVEEIRTILKPYFLRRTKDLVLDLPPLTEIVVPVSMSVLQRQIYKNILERNAAAIEQIYQRALPSTGYKAKARRTNFNNILMELRKTLCHPYIIAPEMEPTDVTPQQAQANLTEASAKLVLLSVMLPKLKAAGHRVLIFTQFKYMLTLLEKYLSGMKYKHLRLDGDTKQLDRQRGIDEFQAPGSEVFCYLLSTRAGGVGINLTSADTVIMFDQDFNPHQDIQAIARAHRIGQTRPVRVFKLLVKGTCEEKIFNAGNKKLGLDHLIIRRIDAKDETEDVESILQYGAKAIFDDREAEATAIRYSDAEIDELLTRSAEPAAEGDHTAAGAFAHAKIWEKTGKLGNVSVEGEDGGGNDDGMHGFWADIIDQQEAAARAARAAAAANIGRGRRTKPVSYQTDMPVSKTRKRGGDSDFDSSGDDFGGRGGYSDADTDDEFSMGFDGRRGRKSRGDGWGNSAPKRPRLSKAERARKRRDQLEMLHKHAKRFNEPELESILIRTETTNVRDQSYWLEEATKFIRGLAESNKAEFKAEDGDVQPNVGESDESKPVTSAISTPAPVTTNGTGTPLNGTTETRDTTMSDVKPVPKAEDLASEAVPAPEAPANNAAQQPPAIASVDAAAARPLVQSTLSFNNTSKQEAVANEEPGSQAQAQNVAKPDTNGTSSAMDTSA